MLLNHTKYASAGFRHQPAGRQTQQGVALAISLVLLVAVTILGVATLSGTRLNEKITSNAQQKATAFEVAESGISAIWSADYLEAVLKDPTLATNDPPAIARPDADTGVSSGFDQTHAVGSTDIEGTVTVQYCGEAEPFGSSLSADLSKPGTVFLLVDVNSIAQVSNTSTEANHLQRGAISVPKTGRTGACITR